MTDDQFDPLYQEWIGRHDAHYKKRAKFRSEPVTIDKVHQYIAERRAG